MQDPSGEKGGGATATLDVDRRAGRRPRRQAAERRAIRKVFEEERERRAAPAEALRMMRGEGSAPAPDVSRIRQIAFADRGPAQEIPKEQQDGPLYDPTVKARAQRMALAMMMAENKSRATADAATATDAVRTAGSEHRGARESRPAARPASRSASTRRASSSSDGDSSSDGGSSDPPQGRDLPQLDPGAILAAIGRLPLPPSVRLRVLWSLPDCWLSVAWAQLATNLEAMR